MERWPGVGARRADSPLTPILRHVVATLFDAARSLASGAFNVRQWQRIVRHGGHAELRRLLDCVRCDAVTALGIAQRVRVLADFERHMSELSTYVNFFCKYDLVLSRGLAGFVFQDLLH